MRRLYVTIPGPSLSGRLVDELLAAGVERKRMRVFARDPRRLDHIGVKVRSFSPGVVALLPAAVAGGSIALVFLVIISIGVAVPWSAPLATAVTVAGAALGAGLAYWHDYPAELKPLGEELAIDDVVMTLDLPDERLGQVEKTIKARHPELKVKGTDPGGSPPFP